MTVERTAEVVVVGAGYAGVTAATLLADAGVDVLLVEARDRVGGRVHTRVHDVGGVPVAIDHGGQWVGPTQRRIRALATRVGARLFPTHVAGLHSEWWSGQLHTYTGPIANGEPEVAAEAVGAALELDLMALTIDPAAPWEAEDAAEWDAVTVESWLRQQDFEHPNTIEAMRLIVRTVLTQEACDVSLLHLLFYIRSAGGTLQLYGQDGTAQDARVVGGAQAIADALAAALGDRVLLGAPARRVEHGPAGVVVHADGVVVRARRAVVTLPPALAGRLSYDPPLPGLRDQLTQRMPMGTVIKCAAVYPTPFWREAGRSGVGVAGDGVVRLCFDNTPADGAVGVLLAFITAGEARRSLRGTPEARRAEVLAFFARFFGAEAAAPLDYVETAWSEEEWSRGCYAGSLGPGGWTAYGEDLRAPVGPLHWAGTETALVWNGYIDGAVESGERAAHEVLAGLGVPADRWPAPLPESGGALGTAEDRAEIAAMTIAPTAPIAPTVAHQAAPAGAGGS